MTTYTACFRGRLVGAIGINKWFNVDIEAKNEDAARGKLYDTHEHIFGLFWLWHGKQTVCRHKDNALALTQKGQTHYVSTYHDGSWRQTDCKLHEVEAVKAQHLIDIGEAP